MKMKKSLLMVAFLAIALAAAAAAAAAPTLYSYKAEAAVIQHYCYTDASNDDHCFADRVQCQQSAQQAGQDKSDCDKTFREKYTATINGDTFQFASKAECEQAVQQYGVQCIRVQ
jgi:ABC-type glycerol-3-phosphate transport system substrate-binding protein